MSNFKVGDMVRVTGNTCAHGFENGSNIFIKEVVGGYCFAYGINGESWAINDQDFEPIPTTRFKVGESYQTRAHGGNYKCINVNEDGSAHLAVDARNPAYVWDKDGRSLSLSSEWDIVFPPVVSTHYYKVFAHGEERETRYNLVDGKVDWSSLEILPCA